MSDSQKTNQSEAQMLISYNLLRRLIGCFGILLPIVLFVGAYFMGCKTIEPSLSDYYHTIMRNIFVGVLCAVALFMFTYKGYDRRDSNAGNLACIFALGVAFFPTHVEIGSCTSEAATCLMPYKPWISTVHFVSAGLFFSVLTYFSLFLFTRSSRAKADFDKQKRKRNTIYHYCGYVMIACVLLIASYFFVLEDKMPELATYKPIFWIETIALWAFGISWLTKGQLVCKDKK
jgi:hypothetical protein